VDSQHRAERSILEAVQRAPFLVQLHYAFQTDDKLHLILDYVSGGELFHHHAVHYATHDSFSEEDARFYVAEVAVAMSHLHGLGIIYRDIKLENILLDSEGHVVLTDFGLSKEMWSEGDRTDSYVGTVDYMAPELVTGSSKTGGYTKAVDWWSFGVLLFELICGSTPFAPTDEERDSGASDVTRKQLDRILKEEPRWPKGASPELLSLLQGLLQKHPEARLGYGPHGSEDVQSHSFFGAVDWDEVTQKRLVPPFRPALHDELDTSNFDAEFTEMDAIISPSHRRGELFRGFSFVAPSVLYDPSALFPNGAPAPDDSFLAKYKLADDGEILGHGAYSICKKCIDRTTGKAYAVKIISSRRCTPDREIRILKTCSGQNNIIDLVDSFKDGLHHYIVMPLMRGGELLDRIRRKRRFTEMEAAGIFKTLIKAIRFLHRNGIVHRDIKPENLLYDGTGDDAQLRIIDFGFAREFTGAQLCQTPALSIG
jgi:serine/threonine protein kinase